MKKKSHYIRRDHAPPESPGYYRFVQANQFEASYAGGEANVAVSLSNFGLDAAFVTKVPNHEIGRCAVNAMRQFGVDTSHISYGGSRLGLYYVEKGASQRPSKVIYDRAGSSIAMAEPGDFHWMKSSAVRTGSTLPALRRLWEAVCRRSAWRRARLRSSWA